jgi:hypothetical protein
MWTGPKIFETGTLGDLGNESTFDGFTGDAVYVGHLENLLVTMRGSADLDATGAMTLQYSQDGTNWAATPASSACTYASPNASFEPTGRVKYIRGLVSACALGGFALRYAGWNNHQREARFGSLGTLDAEETGTAVDVSDLEKVIVTVASNAAGNCIVEASHDASDWFIVTTFTNTNGSVLIPLAVKQIRVRRSSHSSGSALCAYGGVVAAGEQKFGDLGTFTSATTGTAVDVSTLEDLKVRAAYVDDGTFTATATVLIEVSQDGDSWALAPGSSSLTASGNLSITGPAKYLRARCSSYTIGTVDVRYGGVSFVDKV